MSKQLHISELTIGYNNHPIIENINISTNTPQLISVIGRNGKGKSTLLKTLAGITPAIKGNFTFNNDTLLNLPENKLAKKVSFVSTQQTNIANIKVGDYVAFGRYPYTNWLGVNADKDNEKIKEAIEFCGINSLAHRNYDELSDGEKQRVNIARAIAQDTELIILDEPTTHLDLVSKIEVLKLLEKLVRQHQKTVVFSTHMIEHALQIAHEIWLVDDETIESYSPNELIKTKQFKALFCSNHIEFDENNKVFKLK